MKVRVGGAWRDVKSGKVWVAGVWRDMPSAQAYESDAWEEILSFASDLSLSVSPAVVLGEREGSGETQSTSATATPSGGVAPYTYTWTKLSGGAITADAPLLATTRFSGFVNSGNILTATFQCTVEDARGATATDTVSVVLESNSGF